MQQPPIATYRLQLRSDFRLADAHALVDYLGRLGISDLYLSPIFQAREGSTHGYDVVDHTCVDSQYGDVDELRHLADALRQRGLGLILDIVPNHMGINDPANQLWWDLLQNGPGARGAIYFDVDWEPPGSPTSPCVLLPFLGRTFGEALEAGELQVVSTEGEPRLAYFDMRFPLAYTTWPQILGKTLDVLPASVDVAEVDELRSIVTQLQRLRLPASGDASATEEHYREQEVARRRWLTLLQQSPAIRDGLTAVIHDFNGRPGDAKSFDHLEQLLDQQYYRLANWRVAVDEINYRRFFDINDLAAVRVEEPEVFERIHRLPLQLIAEGRVTGLRVDHPDGLLDPADYFSKLRSTAKRVPVSDDHAADDGEPSTGAVDREPYIVAEKILTGGELLHNDWPIEGTTGYEFLSQVSAVLVDAEGFSALQSRYAELTGVYDSPRDIVYESKKSILHESLASELFVLASRLFRVARRYRRSRDWTLPVLLRTLREFIACFPVYRTYVRPSGWEVSAEDEGRIQEAARWAKRRNLTMPRGAFDFLVSVLLLRFPPDLPAEHESEWRGISVRIQQLTAPVAAKGVEDTAFYRYYPLASLNEVGGELGGHPAGVTEFHRLMRRRAEDWPASLSATATHDTKRGEDLRARLHVLSEISADYAREFATWDQLVEDFAADVDGDRRPDGNERYFIHQTLVGTWPVTGDPDWGDYRARLHAYFEKSFREAKQHTSWINPAEGFESAVQAFVKTVLSDRDAPASVRIEQFARLSAGPGFVNSLSQLTLKLLAPGVPDFFQGTEGWDFRLVDPDNRRPVDFEQRKEWLADIERHSEGGVERLLRDLAAGWDDRLKVFVTHRLLALRRQLRELFTAGNYQPLEVTGRCSEQALAFCRTHEGNAVVVVVPRLVTRLAEYIAGEPVVRPPHSFCGTVWNDTRVRLSEELPARWRDALRGGEVVAQGSVVSLEHVFRYVPLAVLVAAQE
jgi:(1->4)-alpha-D-glucan 1-alpha-D-glucosylmutase